jgi:hypothetical protein
MSSDKSVEIAKSLGCIINPFDTDGIFNETKLTELRNTVWKNATTRWVIVCDMDELLTANQHDILEEEKKGTTILTTKGYDIVGDSKKKDLSDIQLDRITQGFFNKMQSKSICFDRTKITDINFDGDSHNADPKGNVKFSEKVYLLYHYKRLGFEYYKSTHDRSAPRAKLAQNRGIHIGFHYTQNVNRLKEEMNTSKLSIETLPALETFYINA